MSPPHPPGVEVVHHPGLEVHQKLHPPCGYIDVHLVLHNGRVRPLLRGELEDPRPLNTRRPEKIAQLLELGLTLAGQAADQRGAQHQTGEPRTQLIQQGHNLRLAATAF